MSGMIHATGRTRTYAIAGVAGLIVVVALWAWLRPSAARMRGSTDELMDRLIAARPDQRDDLIVELGRRGPQVIPQATAAYETAAHDPDLRSQLATVIFRTNDPAQAIPALERLLQQENHPDVRRTLENYLAGLRRPR
ncbi:MAG: hypothetical protein HRF43_11075 [Phycisphaerae bacterium]